MLDAGAEMTRLAVVLGLNREVIRIWFCNRRQAMKNAATTTTTSLRYAPAMTSHKYSQ